MSEKVKLFDRQRHPLGISKERGQLQEGDLFEVVHVWVRSPQGNHLLQKRSAEKKLFPLAWDSAAAGAVGDAEDSARAGARELEEELGIYVEPEALRFLFTAEFAGGFDDYYEVVLEEQTPLALDCGEVSEAGWFRGEEVLALMEDGLFTEHEGSARMEELLREESLSALPGRPLRAFRFDKASGRAALFFDEYALIFEGVLRLEGSARNDSAPLQSARCELSGKRQRWTLRFAGEEMRFDAARAVLAPGEGICPVCAGGLLRGGIVLHQQINWTPESTKINPFSRATRWSLARDEVKLADYQILEPARFPLDFCPRCRRYFSGKQPESGR